MRARAQLRTRLLPPTRAEHCNEDKHEPNFSRENGDNDDTPSSKARDCTRNEEHMGEEVPEQRVQRQNRLSVSRHESNSSPTTTRMSWQPNGS